MTNRTTIRPCRTRRCANCNCGIYEHMNYCTECDHAIRTVNRLELWMQGMEGLREPRQRIKVTEYGNLSYSKWWTGEDIHDARAAEHIRRDREREIHEENREMRRQQQ